MTEKRMIQLHNLWNEQVRLTGERPFAFLVNVSEFDKIIEELREIRRFPQTDNGGLEEAVYKDVPIYITDNPAVTIEIIYKRRHVPLCTQ